ncbi:MAG: SMP-30/gluconolactonase/LRE family protein [Blastocatellia bacterium]|nr:SMP-30/gluconolactonase/LRE family protein [Blastocatellia bacterium]
MFLLRNRLGKISLLCFLCALTLWRWANPSETVRAFSQATSLPPEISSVSPGIIRMEGGIECVVTGLRFTNDIQAAVGDAVIPTVQVTGPTELRFRIPAQAVPGTRTLTLRTPLGIAQQEILVQPKPLVELAVGEITTIAGGIPAVGDNRKGTEVALTPSSLAFDAQGNLYIADAEMDRVRRFDPVSGTTMTIAGNGARGDSGDGSLSFAARLNGPTAVALDGAGNLLIADTQNYIVRRVAVDSGLITTIAGNRKPFFTGDGGSALNTGFLPVAVTVDREGTTVLADWRSNRVFRIEKSGTLKTIANGNGQTLGDGGSALEANLTPLGLAYDAAGNLLILDGQNHRIRRVAAATGTITTIAGNGFTEISGDGGLALDAALGTPRGFCLDAAGNLYIAGNGRVRRVDAQSGIITTIVGGKGTTLGDGGPAENAQLLDPTAVAVDQEGNLYIGDAGTHRIRRVTAATKIITTIVGNGDWIMSREGSTALGAGFLAPTFLALDRNNNLFVGDATRKRIRRVEAGTGTATTIAGTGSATFSGDGGPAVTASLDPGGMLLDSQNNLLVCDMANNRVRHIQSGTGTMTTIAGDGRFTFEGDGGPATAASLFAPASLALDSSGNLLIADSRNSRIRQIDSRSGIISTLAGDGRPTFGGDGGTANLVSFNNPTGVALDTNGVLYVTDTLNHRIRRIEPCSQLASTVAGNGLASFGGDGGPAPSSSINRPYGLLVDGNGDIFLTDTLNHRIRRIEGKTQMISTVAGTDSSLYTGDGGPANRASLGLALAGSLAVDQAGNLYLADPANHAVRVIKGIAKISAAGTPIPCVSISNANFTKPNLMITGSGFGATGAKVAVNDQDVTGLLATQSDTQIVLKGNKKKFNFVKGLNRVTVTNSGGRTSYAELDF